MLETLGYILLHLTLAHGALSDERIALVGCILIGPVVGVMFMGGLLVCVSDFRRWLKKVT